MLDEMILAFSKGNIDLRRNELSEIETKLFDCLIIRLPENFSQLSNSEAKQRYASEFRPEVIYSDNTKNVNFAFNLLHNKNINLPAFLSKFIESIKLVYPNTLIYEEDNLISDIEGCDIRYFEFRTSSLEGPIYNIMYLASNGEKALMGTFNCPFGEYPNWKDMALGVIKTILFE